MVRLVRILLTLLLATFTISLVIGVARSETGAVEKFLLLALIVGCVVCAAKLSTLSANAQERLQRQ